VTIILRKRKNAKKTIIVSWREYIIFSFSILNPWSRASISISLVI